MLRKVLVPLAAVALAAVVAPPVVAVPGKVQLPLPQGWEKQADGKPMRQFGAPALGFQSIVQFNTKTPGAGQVVLARKPAKGPLAADLQALQAEIAALTVPSRTYAQPNGAPCGVAYQVKSNKGLNGWFFLGDRDGQRRGIAVLAKSGVLTELQVRKLAESIGIPVKAP